MGTRFGTSRQQGWQHPLITSCVCYFYRFGNDLSPCKIPEIPLLLEEQSTTWLLLKSSFTTGSWADGEQREPVLPRCVGHAPCWGFVTRLHPLRAKAVPYRWETGSQKQFVLKPTSHLGLPLNCFNCS